jgi:hypothetical protein
MTKPKAAEDQGGKETVHRPGLFFFHVSMEQKFLLEMPIAAVAWLNRLRISKLAILTVSITFHFLSQLKAF